MWGFYPKQIFRSVKLTWPGWNDSGEDIGQGATDGGGKERFENLPHHGVCVMGKYPFVEYIYSYMYKSYVYIHIYIYINTYAFTCVYVSLPCIAKVLKPQQWCCLGIHDFVAKTADLQLPQPRSRFYRTFRRFQVSTKRQIFFNKGSALSPKNICGNNPPQMVPIWI